MQPFFATTLYRNIPVIAYFSRGANIYINATLFCRDMTSKTFATSFMTPYGKLRSKSINLRHLLEGDTPLRFGLQTLSDDFNFPEDYTLEDLIRAQVVVEKDLDSPKPGLYFPLFLFDLLILEYFEGTEMEKIYALIDMMELGDLDDKTREFLVNDISKLDPYKFRAELRKFFKN